MLLNREKLAELLGCSLRTVDEYRRQGLPGESPQKPGGQWRFDSAEVIDWLRTRERQTALGEIAGIDETESRRRKLAAEAAMAEHDLAVKQGSVVAIQDWQSATSQLIGAARARLLSVGSALGPEVAIETDPAGCEALIQGAINEALQELSIGEIQVEPDGDSESQPDNPEDSSTLGATPGPDRERVGGRRAPVKPRVKR